MTLLTCLLSPCLALFLSPLFVGFINRTKAVVAGRKGQPLLQCYFDILRLFKKDAVCSRTTTWIFRAAPRIIFFTTLAATFFVPFLSIDSGLTFTGDIVVLLYLLGLGRFFLVLSALDTGSAFEGMGASREVFYAALAEPVLFTCLLVIMREKNMESITAALSAPLIANSVTVLFAAIPLFIVLLAENARIPFDDPTTHLELTMIHEVMILDNSGPGLALLEYAATIKLWLFSTIIARVLLPVHGNGMIAQAAAMLIIIVLIAFIIGMVESLTARVRLLKAPQLLFGAGTIAILGFFFNITGILIW